MREIGRVSTVEKRAPFAADALVFDKIFYRFCRIDVQSGHFALQCYFFLACIFSEAKKSLAFAKLVDEVSCWRKFFLFIKLGGTIKPFIEGNLRFF